MFVSFLCMFRATISPSSGEITVFMLHFVLVILYGWLFGMQGGIHCTLRTRQNNKYQVSHKYSCFSWWWAHSCPKHVETKNKHTKKNCSPIWLYLQDYTGSTKHKTHMFARTAGYKLGLHSFKWNIHAFNSLTLLFGEILPSIVSVMNNEQPNRINFLYFS